MAGSVLEDGTSAYRQAAVIPFKAHGQLTFLSEIPQILVLSSWVAGDSENG